MPEIIPQTRSTVAIKSDPPIPRRPGLNEECEVYESTVPDEALTDEDEDILNYDDLDDPDAFV